MMTSSNLKFSILPLLTFLLALQPSMAFEGKPLKRFWTSESKLVLEGHQFQTDTSSCNAMSFLGAYAPEYGGWLHVCGQWWSDQKVLSESWYWSSKPAKPFIHPNRLGNSRAPEQLTVTTWTGIWESKLGYLNLTWTGEKSQICGDDPGSCGGGPNATSGLPD